MGPNDIERGSRGRDPLAVGDPDAITRTLLAAGKTRAAAEEAIRAHGPAIRAYLLSLLRDPDVADDAYSVWCEWTLEAIARFRGASPLLTWAYGVAHNAARRVRDDAYRRRRCSLAGAAGVRTAPSRTSSPSRQERAALVDSIRVQLPLDDQGLLALRVEHGLAWEAIAAILSGTDPVTPAALRKRFERVKQRIRRMARDVGALE